MILCENETLKNIIFFDLGQFDLSISTLNLSQGTMTDDRLQQLLSNVPEESIILLEDIDAATVGRHYEKEGENVVQSS